MQLIQQGDADLALCGGSDASLHALWLGAFQQMGVLVLAASDARGALGGRSMRIDAVSWWARVRAWCCWLRRKRRGHCMVHQLRVSGWAMGTDPEVLTQLGDDGETLAYVVRKACARRRVEPEDLACVHAHGTGTLSNDAVEVRVFARLLGPPSKDVPIVSAKGAIGHLLGVAGAAEIVLATLAVQEGHTFGQVTLETPDGAVRIASCSDAGVRD